MPMLKIADLNATHPDYDREQLCEARDLFEGGARMRKHVHKHLIRNDQELDAVFERRCRSAHYLNYCGPIGGYFASFVASQPVRFESGGDDYWTSFSEDCDGKGTDFSTFFTTALIEALTTARAFWRVRFPEPSAPVESRADENEQGLDQALVVPIKAEEIIDWDRDDEGRYLWLRQREVKQVRPGTGEVPRTLVIWTEWRADGTTRRWQAEVEGISTDLHNVADTLAKGDDVPEVDPPYNPIEGRMPIVTLELPPALYLMGHLASPQLESFRKRCALAWSIERTCYAMPYFKLKNSKLPPVMGAGYYGVIGKDDDIIYPSPPTVAYATIAEYNSTLKDEIHRVAQAMARGVDNNAAAIGRSGESKQVDDRATEIVVGAYADRLREAAQQTVGLIAAKNARTVPMMGGLRGYKIVDPAGTIEQFLGLKTAQIHSVTAMQEAEKLVVSAFLPDLSEQTRAKVNTEIVAGLTVEDLDAENEAAKGLDKQALVNDDEEQVAAAQRA